MASPNQYGEYAWGYNMAYSKKRWSGADVHIYEFNQANRDIWVEMGIPNKYEKLSQMAIGAEAKINCGFFGGGSEQLGEQIAGFTQVYYNYEGDQLLHFYNYENTTHDWRAKVKAESTFCFPASWTLIEDGEKSVRNYLRTTHWNQREPRTILAQKPNRNMIFMVVDGRRWNSKGLTAKQCSELCYYLGYQTAVNLDGGGSSEMIVGNKIMNKPSDGWERSIGSCLCCKPK